MFKAWVYPGYVRALRPSTKRKRRSTDRGQLITTGTVLAAALGLNTDTSLVYQLFALLLCLLLASRFTLSLQRPQVAVSRQLPLYATAGQPFEYDLVVTNLGDRAERDLTIIDIPRVTAPSRDEFLNAREPDEDSRNAYDRFIGFHRFVYLQRLHTGVTIDKKPVPDVPRKGEVRVRMSALPARRGIVTLESTCIFHPDPLNINQGIENFDTPASLLVLPKRYQIRQSPRTSDGRHFQPGGISAAWSIGESDEFVSMRDYRDGDSMRKIHWASSAKRTKPVVREYQDEYFVRHGLIVDTQCQPGAIFEEVVSVAASYCLALSRTESMLDLVYQGEQLEILTSGRGTSSVNEQLEALATVTPNSINLDRLTHAALSHGRLVSSYLMVLASYSNAHAGLVRALRGQGIDTQVLLVTDDKTTHQAPPSGTRPLFVGDIQAGLDRL